MELRDYQRRAIEQVRAYLRLLADIKKKTEAAGLGADLDFAEAAWKKSGVKGGYASRRDGVGRSVPAFCFKIPTGGGKTILAVKAVDAVNSLYLKRRTGLVLWIVPTTQIYNQTLRSLRDRQHPYRQHLDVASGGRTVIIERHEGFTPADTDENLVVLMLMLPAANRVTKEQLRMFRDSGGFQAFFPPEDDRKGHAKLLKEAPNLDVFEKDGFWGDQIKTSLGNALRLLRPIIVLDEGQKAYSRNAQDTLNGFNPSVIIELSATPPKGSNVLVDIPGTDLEREEMIKLDLHVINKSSPDWRDTLAAAVTRRDELEQSARKYESATGAYIRPICLVQVERTGKDQREKGYVHSEDVKERLVKTHRIPVEQIAIKTSEKDELKEVDDVGGLLAKECQIRYIITKQALQEGWDCPFAYVLTVLTDPKSSTGMTQLVGRVLRQPCARKTRVKELDESYVFCHRPNAGQLLDDIRRGLAGEGLEDLASRVAIGETFAKSAEPAKIVKVRAKFAKALKSLLLPVFAVNDGGKWRPVSYATDIEAHIRWEGIDVSALCKLALHTAKEKDEEIRVGLGGESKNRSYVTRPDHEGFAFDETYVALHMLDIVPNPWAAHAFGREVIECLTAEHGAALVHQNHAFILEELRKHLERNKDELAKRVFLKRMKSGEMRFLLIRDLGRMPDAIECRADSVTLNRRDGTPLQRSLFEFMPADWFNAEEAKVAWYLEGQDRLFFWLRNRVARDYSIQGWRKDRFWPDFIFTAAEDGKAGIGSVYVIETKGEHLVGNLDTKYKEALVELCNKEARRLDPRELPFASSKTPLRFEVLKQSEWEKRLNEVFGERSG